MVTTQLTNYASLRSLTTYPSNTPWFLCCLKISGFSYESQAGDFLQISSIIPVAHTPLIYRPKNKGMVFRWRLLRFAVMLMYLSMPKLVGHLLTYRGEQDFWNPDTMSAMAVIIPLSFAPQSKQSPSQTEQWRNQNKLVDEQTGVSCAQNR